MNPIALASTLILVLSGVPASAQQQTTKTLDLPLLNPIPRTSELPFAQPRIRYQQWYEGAQFATVITQPVRIIGVEFLGALPSGLALDTEVTMANGSTTLTGFFDQNFVSNKVIVLPRTKVSVGGASTLIVFKEHWIWDGQSNVVLDLKIFDNGAGQKITFAGTSTISATSNTKRQYIVGNPNATTANSPGSTGHYGLITRFHYQEGGNYPYGQGCPGGFNIQPVGTANAVPMPGLATFTQLLSKAGSGYPAVFILGFSKTTFNGAPLPFSLGFLGAPNCSMEASPELLAFTTTVGGGPGTGSAQIPTPVPPIGSLGGVMVYSQWAVLDKAASNGNLATTPGVMHVIGS